MKLIILYNNQNSNIKAKSCVRTNSLIYYDIKVHIFQLLGEKGQAEFCELKVRLDGGYVSVREAASYTVVVNNYNRL